MEKTVGVAGIYLESVGRVKSPRNLISGSS